MNSTHILLIDNYDSFTYNLYQQLASFGVAVQVATNDSITVDDIRTLAPDKIVISPGPKRPEDSGVSLRVIEAFYQTIPILGVCLGHQAIGLVFGVACVHAKVVLHGKTALVTHTNTGLFRGASNPLEVARYHSLALAKVPDGFVGTAFAADQEIMGIQHTTYPLHGIQFHPESFLTPEGNTLIRNFLYEN